MDASTHRTHVYMAILLRYPVLLYVRDSQVSVLVQVLNGCARGKPTTHTQVITGHAIEIHVIADSTVERVLAAAILGNCLDLQSA